MSGSDKPTDIEGARKEERDYWRAKNTELHRRCQLAEAAVREKLRTSNGPHDSRGLYVRMLGCAAVLAEEDTELLRAMVVRLADALAEYTEDAHDDVFGHDVDDPDLVTEARALHVATGLNPTERAGDAQAHGRENERADVVAWLLELGDGHHSVGDLRASIEDGAHHHAATKARGR